MGYVCPKQDHKENKLKIINNSAVDLHLHENIYVFFLFYLIQILQWKYLEKNKKKF